MARLSDLPRGHVAARALARKAATFVRLRQDSEQNRRDALRETSTYTRSQPSARQTPSRPVAWLSTTTASPVAQPAPHSVPAALVKCRCQGSPSCRDSCGADR